MKGYDIFCYGFLMVESPNNDLVNFIKRKGRKFSKKFNSKGEI